MDVYDLSRPPELYEAVSLMAKYSDTRWWGFHRLIACQIPAARPTLTLVGILPPDGRSNPRGVAHAPAGGDSTA
jgi:hypothetical protein